MDNFFAALMMLDLALKRAFQHLHPTSPICNILLAVYLPVLF